MTEAQQFGSAEHRSGSGALLSGEVERIKGFLRGRGLLLAEGVGGWLIVVHPAVAVEVERALLKAGLRRVVLGASLEELRRVADLTVGETRALEVLSPGPLIVATGSGDATQATLMAVPDNGDLRAIASASGGTATAFLQTDAGARVDVASVVSARAAHDPAFRHLGILGPSARQNAPEMPTVVRISGPGRIECLAEGALAVDAVRAASDLVSQWEIEDWT